jgi:hypothetical protein
VEWRESRVGRIALGRFQMLSPRKDDHVGIFRSDLIMERERNSWILKRGVIALNAICYILKTFITLILRHVLNN